MPSDPPQQINNTVARLQPDVDSRLVSDEKTCGSGLEQEYHRGAAVLEPADRKALAISALARTKPLAQLAREADVSRKFVYQQTDMANTALDNAFKPSVTDDEVLFYLPVTRRTICAVILALILLCHSSYQGVIEFLRAIFAHDISMGTVHNVVADAVRKAREINCGEDLSRTQVGLHDELFQGDPVLVGVDAHSTYCYLLSSEPTRDATTWGVHLLGLAERGLNPEHTVADAGSGLRAGQAEAWPGVPCWGDVFHGIREVGKMSTYLDNRAVGAIGHCEKLGREMERAKKRGKGQSCSKRLALARKKEQETVALADDIRVLATWLRDDVLALCGPEEPVRRELYDFIVAELRAREHLAPHRIKPVRTALENQRDDLLAFAKAVDTQLVRCAHRHQVPIEIVREVFEMERCHMTDLAYWQHDAALWKRLGESYHGIRQDVQQIAEFIVRASSLVENINSRLRCYFFLRRQVANDYLELLRFFFNHRRFPRSRKDFRRGKSPVEILVGEPQPHWLEQLGFPLFQRAG